MSKKKVLFICVHNSARSQMAEAILKNIAGDRFEVESAGLEPGALNPVAVDAMKEMGIDISKNKTKSAFDFYKQGKIYNYVITVCDGANAKRCPIFPSVNEIFHWSFKDPSGFIGTHEEKVNKTIKIRDQIKEALENWIKELEKK